MIRQRLNEWLEQNSVQLAEDIAALVRIESVADMRDMGKPTPFGTACRKALEQMLFFAERDGMEAFDCDGYCVSVAAGCGDMEIGIWNHLDVVPAGEGWLYPPFELTRAGDWLIGRGVQDNKGPAMAVYYALLFCSREGLLKNIRVRQILGCQEEAGMADVRRYLERCSAPDYSFVADCAFPVCCGEKGICRVTLENKGGVGRFMELEGGTVCNSVPSRAFAALRGEGGPLLIEAEGIGGHAAFPEKTVNAVGVLAEKLERCGLDCCEGRIVSFLKKAGSDGYGEGLGIACADEVSGRLTCNAGVVDLRDGKLTVKLDIRYPVTKKSGPILERLGHAAAADGFAVTQVQDESPCYMEKDHPFIKVLMNAWREETGKDGQPYVMGGGTYARHIPRAVGFGTGMEHCPEDLGLPEGHGGCHCADEAESMENLKAAVRIYVNALVRLDGWCGRTKGETRK